MICTEDMITKGDWVLYTTLINKTNLYILKYKKKTYLVDRVGICKYKKCKNACCKFFNENNLSINSYKYFLNFGSKAKYGVRGINFKITCKKLCLENGKCKVWDKKSMPEACKQFPHPEDILYWQIMDKCSFKFRILYELKEVKS